MIDKISLIAVFPEIILLIMACVIALFDLSVKSRTRTATYVVTMLTLAVVAALLANAASSGQTLYGFGNMVVSDVMGNWLKCFATLAVMVTLVYGRHYAAERDMLRGGELFVLSLFSLLGMFVMISGNNFLVIYMGVELLTLSSYALVALRRDYILSVEAGMKYFVLGALASGFLLYGMSMLYGATGTLNVQEALNAIHSGQIKHQVLVFGLVFIVAGLAFKLGVVPFHMWIPDVYQGAPTAITLMIGGAPKLAAFAVLIRLLVEGMLPLSFDWQPMLMLLAIGSLAIGNLAAIAQTNIKRMLAFSTISHMGFVLIGMMSGIVMGHPQAAGNAYGSSMFYVVSYVLTTLAKLAVLQALLASGGTLQLVLAVFAVMMSLVGAFYYLRVVKVMYFDAPSSTAGQITAPFEVRAVLSLNGALLLVLGLVPGGLMALCANAIRQMLTT